MFVALREIRTAWGRFALMVGAVAMITFLLVVLAGLTQGLGRQSTSAIEALPADRVVLTTSGDQQASYGDSVIDRSQQDAWSGTPGVTVTPLSIGHARLEMPSGTATSVALFGAAPRGVYAGNGSADTGATTDLTDTQIALPEETADVLGAKAGARVTLNGTELTVARVEPTRWYAHSPVATVTAATFAATNHLDPKQVGSVLLADVDPSIDDATLAALDTKAGTTSFATADSLAAIPGYRSEHSSLLLIQAFLYGISALVVLSFVSVWTIQRTRDLAVLRALGASRRYVLRDALGQAALLLFIGALTGGILGAALVAGLASVAPILLTVLVVTGPVVGTAALGLAGSWLATARVSRVDPLLALGGN